MLHSISILNRWWQYKHSTEYIGGSMILASSVQKPLEPPPMSNPFSPAQLWSLADQFGTPLWVYDAATIRQRIAQVSNFETVRFAQKACSNIHILKLMREEGVKVDAVSRGEILRALAAGYAAGGESSDIVFTADLFDAATLDCVVEHGVP